LIFFKVGVTEDQYAQKFNALDNFECGPLITNVIKICEVIWNRNKYIDRPA